MGQMLKGLRESEASYRFQENVAQVFQPVQVSFEKLCVENKALLAIVSAGWKTCATYHFINPAIV